MHTWIRRAFAPPVFEDEEKTRVARSLNTMLLGAMVFAVVYGIGAPLLYHNPASIMISAALALLLWLGALWLMRRGRVRLAAWLFLCLLWAAATVVAVFHGAGSAPTLGAYITLICTAGLLLGERGGLSFVVLSVLSSLGLVFAQVRGVLLSLTVLTPFEAWVGLMTYLVMATMALYLVIRNMNDARALAQSQERALAERAAELAQMNKQLEQEIAKRLAAEQAGQQAEDELRQVRRRQQLYFEQTPLAMIEWNLAFRVVEWNPTAEAIFGFSRSQALGQHASLIVPGDARKYVAHVWNTLLATGSGERSVNENVHRDGRRIWCEWYNTPLVNDAGNVIGIASLVQDITRRKQAEEALRESGKRYQTLAEAVHDMIFIINRQGYVEYANSFAARQFGCAPEEMVGKSRRELFAPQVAERQAYNLRQVFETGQPVYIEGQTGFLEHELWLGTWLVPIHAEDGEVTAILGVARDITRRKQAEQSLQASEGRFRLMADKIGDGLIIIENNQVVYVNDRACEIFGYPRQELVKLTELDVAAPEERDRLLQIINDAQQSGTELPELEFWIVRQDGTRCCLHNRYSSNRRGDEIVVHYIMTTDITERKRMEERLHRQLQELMVLHAVAVAAAAATNESDLIEQATQIIGAALYSDNFGVMLLDQATGQLIPHSSYHISQASEVIKIMIGQGVTGTVAQTGQPWRVSDVNHCPEYIRVDTRTRSELCVPLKIGERVIGIINAEIALPDAFTESDERLLMTVARQLTTAIEKVRLFEAERRRLQELTVLHAVAVAGAEATSEDALIESATRLIGETLYPDNFGVLLLDEAGGVLWHHPSYRGRATAGASVPLGQGITGRVALDGQPRRISNVSHETDCVSVDPEVRSELCVPLRLGGHVIGVINAESSKPNNFTGADESLFITFAGQLATAIEKVRLFEAERQRRQEAETLQEIIATLASILDLDQVLSSLLASLERVIPYDSACVFLIEKNKVKAVAGRGFPLPEQVIGHEFAADNALFRESFDTARPLILQDALADSRFQRWGGTDYVRGWIGVPMIAHGRVIGVLTIDSRSVGAYGAPEAALAQAFANQAAIAIENARLFEAERAARQQAETLRAATQALSVTLDLPEVFELILSELQKVVPYDSASVQQLVGDKLKIIGGRGFPNPEEIIGLVFDPSSDDNPNREVMRTCSPLIVNDVVPYYKNFQRAPHAQAKIRSWLGVPLIFQDRLLGMVTLDKKEPNFYTEAHVRLALAFAAQAATALENAMLYTKTQEHASQLADNLVQLQELDRLKSEFIQNVSHELRTPLSIVLGYAEMLAGGELGELQPDQQEPVAIIARRGRMLKKMVENLTAILEAEAGGLEQESVDVAALACSLLGDFQVSAEKANLSLLVDIESNVPPVQGDPTHLLRVLDNLLSNALKFTPAGGTVKMRVWRSGARVIVEVADTGIGIPQNQLEKIFDRFYQVDGSMSRPYSGVGLGLALVKEIVEAHGGQVSVQSMPGEGSTFQVILPISELA